MTKLARDSKQTNVINDGLLVAFFFIIIITALLSLGPLKAC